MSRKLVFGVVALTGLVVFAGCLESKTVVSVEKDGSGTVEQTVYMKDLDLPFPGAEKPSPEEEFAKTREQAEQTAQKMGEGVALETVERIAPRDGWNGIRTVYSFQDVNKLGVAPMPELSFGGLEIGDQGPGMDDFPPVGEGDDPDAMASPPNDEEEQVRFEFTAEPTPKLTILTPPMTPPADAGPPEAGQDPQEQAMAKMMMMQVLDGMLVEFQVKVDGKITDTDAKYVSASRQIVGLLRMDFGALTKDPAAFDKMMTLEGSATPEEIEKQLQDSQLGKHIKMETKERVEVSFE